MNLRLASTLLAFISSAALLSAGESLARRGDGQGGVTLTAEMKEDLGDLREAPLEGETAKFRLNVSMRADVVTNARLRGNHGDGDVLYTPSLEAGYITKLGGGFGIDISARLETVGYADATDRSFWNASGLALLEWKHPTRRAPRLYGGAELYHFDSYENGNTLGEAIGLIAGIDDSVTLNNGRGLLFGGFQFTQYQAHPRLDNRHQHRALIGYTQQLSSYAYGQVYYSYQFSDYWEQDRQDSRHILGASVIYQFSERLFGNVSGSFVDNDSTQPLATYQNASLGFGVTWQF